MVGRAACVSVVLALVCISIGSANLFETASRSAHDQFANISCGFPSISHNGRYVAFESMANNLVPNDTNNGIDVFLRDLWQNRTTRVSVSSSGAQGNAQSVRPLISPNGRYVVFQSYASTLVAESLNSGPNVYCHDRQTGQTILLSKGPNGAGDAESWATCISPDGQTVAFDSRAGNLVAGDANLNSDVFIVPIVGGTPERVSLNNSGTENGSPSWGGQLTQGAQKVLYLCDGNPNVLSPPLGGLVERVAGQLPLFGLPTDGPKHLWGDALYIRDRSAGTTKALAAGVVAGGGRIAANGEDLVLVSEGNLTGTDLNSLPDVYRIRLDGSGLERVSVAPGGGDPGGASGDPSISANGNPIAFASGARNLVPHSGDWAGQIYVASRGGGIELVTRAADGEPGDRDSYTPAISGDGEIIALASRTYNLDPRTNYPRPQDHVLILVSGDGAGLADMVVQHPPGPWVGEGVHGSNGFRQTVRADVRIGLARTYYVAVENDGTRRDMFTVHGTPAHGDWVVHYFLHFPGGSRQVTDEVTSPEGVDVPVSEGDSRLLHVHERADPGVSVGDQKTVKVWAQVTAFGYGEDLVQAVTTAEAGGQPDLVIQTQPLNRIGEGIINETGEGQTLAAATKKRTRLDYDVLIANTALVDDEFILRATPGDADWQVRYFKQADEPAGSGDEPSFSDITAQITSAAGHGPIRVTPTMSRSIRIQVKPVGDQLLGGAKKALAIWARYTDDPVSARQDLVRAVTSLQVDGKPDLWVRHRPDPWRGNDLYNPGSLEQRVSAHTTQGSAAVFDFCVQNDGTEPDDFAILGDEGDADWQVRYFNALSGGADVTAQVTGAKGWGPVRLGVGKTQRIRVEVMPIGALADGSWTHVNVSTSLYQRGENSDGGACRTFFDSVAPASTIAGLMALPSAGGAEVAFSLSAAADVSARVLNLAGRPVRTLCVDQACQAGVTRLVWNAQADTGLRVPSGQYLVEVTARSPQGGQSRALATVRLMR